MGKGDFKSEYPFASCQAYQVKLTCREGPCRFQSWFAPEETSNHRAINHQYDYVHDVDASATEGSGAGLCVGGVLMHIGALMLMMLHQGVVSLLQKGVLFGGGS